MHKKAQSVEDMRLHTYGVCCSRKDKCSLSYESEQFGQLIQLLQTPEGPTDFKDSVAGFLRFFQCNTATCSVCHQPVVNTTGRPLGRNIDAKRLDRILRLRNQLLGLEILSV
jgi:hypothetical protein